MFWLTDNSTFNMLGIIIALIVIFVTWNKWRLNYWKRKGVACPETTFLLGNANSILAQKESFGDFIKRMYNFHKKSHKDPHGGYYFLLQPIYLPLDPELVKSVMQNDFNHFVDRGVYFNEKDDPLSAHLFAIEGQKWRNLRAKLTPTFTSGRMKMMFETLVKCGDQLHTQMDISLDSGPINIKDILVRFTTDIIGNCAFGIECNSLKNPDNEFTNHMAKVFQGSFWENLVGFFTFVLPDLMKALRVSAVKKSISKFFIKVVTDVTDYREKNNVYRKDFMHLLLQLKNKGKLTDDESVLRSEVESDNKSALTMNEVAAQAFVFFLAGFETSSTTMTFCLFELASNPDIQEKVRKEIIDVLKRHDNKLTYDAIMEMHYMDKVIYETLRKYPPLPLLNRICTKEFQVPGTNVVLEKGTKVIIPVLGLQHDPEYYPNPEKFDPERFSEENKSTRHPYTFIPFGEGPRVCIGVRFGMMQTKVGLSVLIKNYSFFINQKTTVPLQIDPKSFIMTIEGGIWLDYKKL